MESGVSGIETGTFRLVICLSWYRGLGNAKKRASTSRLKNIWEEKMVEFHNLKVKEKSREKARVNRGRRRPEYAHRRQIEPGFVGCRRASYPQSGTAKQPTTSLSPISEAIRETSGNLTTEQRCVVSRTARNHAWTHPRSCLMAI